MAAETVVPGVRRVKRPGLRDPRLGVGVVLVAGSVALGGWAVEQADRTVQVYVAREVLTPGETVGDEQLSVTAARLPSSGSGYLLADDPLPTGLVATRTVGQGELVPAAAVAAGESLDTRPVSLLVQGSLSNGVVPGALVDLWSTPTPAPSGRGTGDPVEPVLVAQGLRVADVREEDGLFSGAAASAVEVLVPRDELPSVLRAVAGDGKITLVPLTGRR